MASLSSNNGQKSRRGQPLVAGEQRRVLAASSPISALGYLGARLAPLSILAILRASLRRPLFATRRQGKAAWRYFVAGDREAKGSQLGW